MDKKNKELLSAGEHQFNKPVVRDDKDEQAVAGECESELEAAEAY